jgi:hypothetical protein
MKSLYVRQSKLLNIATELKTLKFLTNSYAHVHPNLIRMEFTDGKQLGEYETIEEAKFAATNSL